MHTQKGQTRTHFQASFPWGQLVFLPYLFGNELDKEISVGARLSLFCMYYLLRIWWLKKTCTNRRYRTCLECLRKYILDRVLLFLCVSQRKVFPHDVYLVWPKATNVMLPLFRWPLLGTIKNDLIIKETQFWYVVAEFII